jgi:hypothetical protein
MKLLGVLLLVLCGGISAIPVAEARVDADGDEVPDLLAEGNVGYEILRQYDAMPAGITLFDAVVQYLETLGGPLTPDNSRRVTWIDSPR